MLLGEDNIWRYANKTEVTLKVSKLAAHCLLRRKPIGGQTIEKELKDGGLIASGKVAHPNRIGPTVRIICPEGLQVDMALEMRGYLEKQRRRTSWEALTRCAKTVSRCDCA